MTVKQLNREAERIKAEGLKKIEIAKQLPTLRERTEATNSALHEMWSQGDKLLLVKIKPRAVVRFRNFLGVIAFCCCFIQVVTLLNWLNAPSSLNIIIISGIIILIGITDSRLNSRDD